jgi:hypothetical protein
LVVGVVVANINYTVARPFWNEYIYAEDGPRSWQRVAPGQSIPDRSLPPVHVKDVHLGHDSLSFHVDRINVPVLVKASYFPTWTVDGGRGPYRVEGNMMVVIPTRHDVRLHFGRGAPVLAGEIIFFGGLVGVVGLAVFDARKRRGQRSAGSSGTAEPSSR